jgi:NADH-quinone oxidoreductase subunit N
MLNNYIASIAHYLPELIAAISMVGLLLIDASYKNTEHKKPLFYGFAYFALICILFLLCTSLSSKPMAIFTGAAMIDPFSTFAKILMVIGTIFCIYLNQNSTDIYEELRSEYVTMIVGVLIGGMMLVSANNMLILYLGIETLSILSYVLAALKKRDDRSSEAGLKYALYGGVTAGLMLFGMSHIYGVLGTIHFSEIITKMATVEGIQVKILLPSFLLFFAGIGYKIACAPFHMWTPDVYEGSPLPVTTFFSIVPKIAGVVALTRITMVFFGTEGALQVTWVGLLAVMSVLTMFVGNISAIGQRSVKRMLAYSSIGHAGFMMLGAVVINEVGTSSILFYSATYLFMTLVAFYITTIVSDKYGNDHFERFSGLINRYPFIAIFMAIAMFSLAGLPPFSGFVAKFNILAAVVKKGYYTLAIMAGINSVISVYYYMKIVRLMILKPSECNDSIEKFSYTNQALIFALTVPILVLGIFWSKLMEIVQHATIFIN